ncbi:MAG: hypothetical protein K2M88_02225 [Muribaculaceae bacterium]|nr:hypothetical protein [Muribaculaceae bacterium]
MNPKKSESKNSAHAERKRVPVGELFATYVEGIESNSEINGLYTPTLTLCRN